MKKAKKIGELSTGEKDLELHLRNGEKTRARGEVVETKQGNCLITHCSPKKSFGPGTKVRRHRKG